MSYQISAADIGQFIRHLRGRGASSGTMEKYQRDVRRLAQWLEGRDASQENVTRWKESLVEQGLCHTTVNSMLAAANAFSGGWAGGSGRNFYGYRKRRSGNRPGS